MYINQILIRYYVGKKNKFTKSDLNKLLSKGSLTYSSHSHSTYYNIHQ